MWKLLLLLLTFHGFNAPTVTKGRCSSSATAKGGRSTQVHLAQLINHFHALLLYAHGSKTPRRSIFINLFIKRQLGECEPTDQQQRRSWRSCSDHSWDQLAIVLRCFQAYVVDSRYSSNIQSLNPAAVIDNHLVNLHERIQLVIQSGNSGKCHMGRWPTKATTSNDGIKDWHTGHLLVEQSVWLVLTRSHILSVGGRCRKSYRECHHLLPLHYLLSC